MKYSHHRINTHLYISALMLTHIKHSGTNPDFHKSSWESCLVVPELNTCDSWHATCAGCIWPVSFLCDSARWQCYGSANCFLLLYIGFISVVLICSCSRCGMGVCCCSVSGVCTQVCQAPRELPEWTVVPFSTCTLTQRAEFFKGIQVFMPMGSKKLLSNILCSVYMWAVCVLLLSIVLYFLCCVLFMLTCDRCYK